jgi:hypothetical protein
MTLEFGLLTWGSAPRLHADGGNLHSRRLRGRGVGLRHIPLPHAKRGRRRAHYGFRSRRPAPGDRRHTLRRLLRLKEGARPNYYVV